MGIDLHFLKPSRFLVVHFLSKFLVIYRNVETLIQAECSKGYSLRLRSVSNQRHVSVSVELYFLAAASCFATREAMLGQIKTAFF